jgi:hypothetical protein
MSQICRHMRAFYTVRHLHVAALAEIFEKHGSKVRVLHESTTDPSRTAFHRYPRDNVTMEAELANAAARDLSLVVDIRNS